MDIQWIWMRQRSLNALPWRIAPIFHRVWTATLEPLTFNAFMYMRTKQQISNKKKNSDGSIGKNYNNSEKSERKGNTKKNLCEKLSATQRTTARQNAKCGEWYESSTFNIDVLQYTATISTVRVIFSTPKYEQNQQHIEPSISNNQ